MGGKIFRHEYPGDKQTQDSRKQSNRKWITQTTDKERRTTCTSIREWLGTGGSKNSRDT